MHLSARSFEVLPRLGPQNGTQIAVFCKSDTVLAHTGLYSVILFSHGHSIVMDDTQEGNKFPFDAEG